MVDSTLHLPAMSTFHVKYFFVIAKETLTEQMSSLRWQHFEVKWLPVWQTQQWLPLSSNEKFNFLPLLEGTEAIELTNCTPVLAFEGVFLANIIKVPFLCTATTRL